MRNEIELTNEQIEAIFEKHGFLLDVDDLVFTRDTLDDFREGPIFNVFDYGNVIEFTTGREHKCMCVVDFGTVRASTK